MYLQKKGEHIEGTIVHLYRQGNTQRTIAVLDTGHTLVFTLRMMRALCPIEGSIMQTDYGYPRHDEHIGKHYYVSRRWKRIKAYECKPIECKPITMETPYRVKTFSIAEGWH